MVPGKPIRSTSAPAAIRPSGSPYTASIRTPITRPRKRSSAARSRLAAIEIMAMLWAMPVTMSTAIPAVMVVTYPKASRSAYQIAV